MAETDAATKWRVLIAEQARSGKSVTGFCRERGVSRDVFFRWRKRLKAGEGSKADGFIEVRAAEEEPAKVLRITTPGGYRVELPWIEDVKAAEGMLLRVLGALR